MTSDNDVSLKLFFTTARKLRKDLQEEDKSAFDIFVYQQYLQQLLLNDNN